MVFKVRKTVIEPCPEIISNARGGFPITFTSALMHNTEVWLVAWDDAFGVVNTAENLFFNWADLWHLSFNGETQTLTVTFANPQLPELIFQLSVIDEKFMNTMRVQLDRSIIFQKVLVETEGKIYGLVRKNTNDSFFTQVVLDGVIADEKRIATLHNELCDLVGLPYQAGIPLS